MEKISIVLCKKKKKGEAILKQTKEKTYFFQPAVLRVCVHPMASLHKIKPLQQQLHCLIYHWALFQENLYINMCIYIRFKQLWIPSCLGVDNKYLECISLSLGLKIQSDKAHRLQWASGTADAQSALGQDWLAGQVIAMDKNNLGCQDGTVSGNSFLISKVFKFNPVCYFFWKMCLWKSLQLRKKLHGPC